jgi:hypothetical protein
MVTAESDDRSVTGESPLKLGISCYRSKLQHKIIHLPGQLDVGPGADNILYNLLHLRNSRVNSLLPLSYDRQSKRTGKTKSGSEHGMYEVCT